MEETLNSKDLNRLKITHSKKNKQKNAKQHKVCHQITEMGTERESRNRTERYTYDNKKLRNVSEKQNLQNKIRKGSQRVQLPTLKKTFITKRDDTEQSIQVNPKLFQSALYGKGEQNDFENSIIKQEYMVKLNSFNRSLKVGIVSHYKQNITQRRQYIDKLNIIRLKGIQLQKSTNGVLKQANYAGRVISKKYGALKQNSNSILTGVQDYLLQEQKSRKYKREILDMWMKYDK